MGIRDGVCLAAMMPALQHNSLVSHVEAGTDALHAIYPTLKYSGIWRYHHSDSKARGQAPQTMGGHTPCHSAVYNVLHQV